MPLGLHRTFFQVGQKARKRESRAKGLMFCFPAWNPPFLHFRVLSLEKSKLPEGRGEAGLSSSLHEGPLPLSHLCFSHRAPPSTSSLAPLPLFTFVAKLDTPTALLSWCQPLFLVVQGDYYYYCFSAWVLQPGIRDPLYLALSKKIT